MPCVWSLPPVVLTDRMDKTSHHNSWRLFIGLRYCASGLIVPSDVVSQKSYFLISSRSAVPKFQYWRNPDAFRGNSQRLNRNACNQDIISGNTRLIFGLVPISVMSMRTYDFKIYILWQQGLNLWQQFQKFNPRPSHEGSVTGIIDYVSVNGIRSTYIVTKMDIFYINSCSITYCFTTLRI